MEQEVESCISCPFYSEEYYGEFCSQIGSIKTSDNKIATDCPLKEKPITVKLKTN